MKILSRISVVLLCLGLAGCATATGFQQIQGYGLMGETSLDTCIPVYTGEPPQNITYKDLGPVKGTHIAQFFEGSYSSMNKAIEDIANNAKAMNANAVIKTQIHGGSFTPNIYAEGEAVVFKALPGSGSHAMPQSHEKINLQSGDELTAKMKTLKKLLSDGLITEKDFDERKGKLLDEYTNGQLAGPQADGNAASNSTPGSSSQQAGIPAGKAVVYIYRTVGPTFGPDVKIPFSVKANGNILTTLVQGGYYRYVTNPGSIKFGAFDTGFMAPTSVFSITVDATAGQAYYLKGAHGKGMSGRAHLELVSPEEGADEITNCREITTP